VRGSPDRSQRRAHHTAPRRREAERSALIRSGELGIALCGNWRTALVIGNQARLTAAFGDPHRVLKGSTEAHEGGFVAEEWQDDEGRGPDEAARRWLLHGAVADYRAIRIAFRDALVGPLAEPERPRKPSRVVWLFPPG